MIVKQLKLYGLILALALLVLVVAIGGGLWGQAEPWFLQWQHQAFARLCHQIPERSFAVAGQPMAVCSRCLGVYSGFLMGWMLLPLFILIGKERVVSNKVFILVAVSLNLIDLVGNFLGFWQNTLLSRVLLGGFAGIAAAMLFSGVFFTSTTSKSNEGYYGRLNTINTK